MDCHTVPRPNVAPKARNGTPDEGFVGKLKMSCDSAVDDDEVSKCEEGMKEENIANVKVPIDAQKEQNMAADFAQQERIGTITAVARITEQAVAVSEYYWNTVMC